MALTLQVQQTSHACPAHWQPLAQECFALLVQLVDFAWEDWVAWMARSGFLETTSSELDPQLVRHGQTHMALKSHNMHNIVARSQA